MTPEERAKAVVGLLKSDFGKSGEDAWFYAIRDEIHAAVLKENEACAVLAKSMTGARPRQIAEAIRARTADK